MHKQEVINRAIILLLGLLAGVMTFVLRRGTPDVQAVQWIKFQYTIMFTLLGLLPMLRFRANDPSGRAVTEFLTIVILIVSALQPVDIVLNSLIAATVFLGSIAYFRFYAGSIGYFIILVGVLLFETYVYIMYTFWLWFQASGDPRFVMGLGMATIIVFALMRMLMKEYRKSTAANPVLGSALNPLN